MHVMYVSAYILCIGYDLSAAINYFCWFDSYKLCCWFDSFVYILVVFTYDYMGEKDVMYVCASVAPSGGR